MTKVQIFKGVGKFLKSIDVYGPPISLTYKKETTFKTKIGGFLTILSKLAIFGWLFL
jgi:hypothetical protein